MNELVTKTLNKQLEKIKRLTGQRISYKVNFTTTQRGQLVTTLKTKIRQKEVYLTSHKPNRVLALKSVFRKLARVLRHQKRNPSLKGLTQQRV